MSENPDDVIIAPPPQDATEAATPPADTTATRFAVPLVIELENTTVPLERLQGLREGAVLPLDAGAGALTARVLAGGRPIARGTLVAIGDGYGILIDDDRADA
jgi:flagellar motor switch protein FliN/FliY